MQFFDASLPLGRTNKAVAESPRTEAEALALMDRYDVAEALVFHTVGRDSDPELGNRALGSLASERLHQVWALDPACVRDEPAGAWILRGVRQGMRAVLVNPLMSRIRPSRSPRLAEVAEQLAERQIPMLFAYRSRTSGEDAIDWYDLADFCATFPHVPMIAWEFRTRSNRPLFDALSQTENLIVSTASLWQAQMVEQIARSFGPHRLVFSLGLPLLDPGTFQAVVRYADLPEPDREAIAHGTLRALLQEAYYE